MELSTLTRIYSTVGPCLSVYAPRDAAWSDVTASAESLDLSWPAVQQVMDAAPAAFAPDDAGVAAFAWPDRAAFAQGLPAPPASTIVESGALPYGAPLLESLEIAVPHVVLAVGDGTSDVVTFGAFDEPSTRSIGTDAGSGFASVVEHAVEAARASSADLLLVAATDAVRNSLVDRLATAVPFHCEVIGIDPDDGDIAETAVRLVSDRTARGTVDTLHRFRFARSHDAAAEGVADTVAALQAGRVRLLLVHDDPADDRTAWIGDGATHIGTSADDARSIGVEQPSEVRLTDAAIRSCLLAGGLAHTIPGHVADGPADGIGATLAV